MQVDWVNVIAGIAHPQPIPPALLQVKYGWRYVARHWVRDAIDCPAVEAFLSGVFFRKCHFEGLVWVRSALTQFREACVVPLESRRRTPLCFARSPSVLHHDSHAMPAITVVEITQNPDAWTVHANYRGDAFRRADPKNRHGCWIRNRISIKRDNLK